MKVEIATRRKLSAFVGQIDQLLLSDFPHESSRAALNTLKRFFNEQLERLERAVASGDRALISRACITSNGRILAYLPILGFLLRSTNVRNSFEVYDALLDLGRDLIGPDAELVLSSEWDFSPLTYAMSVRALPNFILVGLPSSESSNALVFPLAGHELGHTVWVTENLEDKFAPLLEARVYNYLATNWARVQGIFRDFAHISPDPASLSANIFASTTISNILNYSISQVEEIFCDAVGQHLFGKSYALSFHYLLAPSLGGDRSLEYPTLKSRASFISQYGGVDLQQLGFASYINEFEDKQPNLPPKANFTVECADQIAIDIAREVYDTALTIVKAKASRHQSNAKSEENVLDAFSKGVPAREPLSLADILNAGWDYLLRNRTTFDENEGSIFDWVSELVLKSIEVLEFRRRLSHA